MPPDRRSSRLFHVPAGLLIAAFFLQSFFSSLLKSPSSDEPIHIAAGLSYVQKGIFRPNPEHPPLIKELSAVSMLAAGIRLPQIPAVDEMFVEPPGRQLERPVGDFLIARNNPRRVMFWARLPLIVLSTLLALLLYIWGRQIVGDPAALGALFLYALDPTLVAHSYFVTTDVGLAAFTVLFFFLLWHYLRRPETWRLIVCGLAMGLLLCAKYSAIFMIPVALLPMLAAVARRGGRQVFQMSVAFLTMCVIAGFVILAVYRSPSGISQYAHGVELVRAEDLPAFTAFMAGDLQHRFYTYFAVAWLLKEPLATIALVFFGAFTLIRCKSMSLVDKLFIFAPPAALFAACSLFASNIGLRYIIPVFPFAYLAGGAGLAALIRSRIKPVRALAALACLWIAIAAAGIYPDHLSYFNEAACLLDDPGKIGLDGGSRCGTAWLDDSNVDWGQGLVQLRAWMDKHPDPRTIRLETYYGTFPAEAYGIPHQHARIGEFDDGPRETGLYALSAEYVARGRTSWLKTTPPTAVVGHALYIYDVP